MSNYSLFSVMGIEIEYMLVDKETLAVQPKSDVILHQLAGHQVNEVVQGDIGISNELVLHVLELKNDGPKPPSYPFVEHFQQTILGLQSLLEQYQIQLLPTGAHPWMNPMYETKRWPHGDKSIYQQYNSIFNCQGHGWSNLQSMHVNLPFLTDDDFCQLHNTIRLLLPLLPGLAASTPILDGKPTGFLDARLSYYATNQQKIPSIAGDIIPEFIHSEAQYQSDILNPMYRDIARVDPEGILQHEWLNSRAAIAKFERQAIEIRIIDSQECVSADIAIAKAIHAILKHWYDRGSRLFMDNIYDTTQLKAVYQQIIKEGLGVKIEDKNLLAQWQLPHHRGLTVREVWSLLIEQASSSIDFNSQCALEYILREGNLSERILRSCNGLFSKENLNSVYRQLGDCLLKNQQFKSS